MKNAVRIHHASRINVTSKIEQDLIARVRRIYGSNGNLVIPNDVFPFFLLFLSLCFSSRWIIGENFVTGLNFVKSILRKGTKCAGILYELLIKKDRYGGLSILLRQIHRVDDYSFCIFHFREIIIRYRRKGVIPIVSNNVRRFKISAPYPLFQILMKYS